MFPPAVPHLRLDPMVIAGVLFAAGFQHTLSAPHQATGFKIGETTTTSAIVWTRLTRKTKANPPGSGMFEIEYASPGKKGRRGTVTGVTYADGKTADDLDYAAPGTPGETRVRYRPVGGDQWLETPWMAVEPEWDHTRQHSLTNLSAATTYEVSVESRSPGGEAGDVLKGGFVTAPDAKDTSTPVVFTVSTGQMFADRNSDDGFAIYDSMLRLPDLSFFVHTGDIVYYDREAKTAALANWHWQRTYSLPSNARFHRRVGSYFIKDDHDTWTNDCWPAMRTKSMGTFTFAQGLDIFVHQVPMDGRDTIRTRRWGRDLQIWLVEGRDFRSANPDADGPEKTIWGAKQKAWFKKSFAESNAAFRILISPTPIVGPDRDSKNDNLANRGFTHEGDEIRAFLGAQKNAFVICGDRHWQYHSIHPATGVQEFSCGPASDKHAGGWKQSDFRADYHQFLRVQGGFLAVRGERVKNQPTLTFRFHGEDGKVAYEKAFTSNP